MFITTFAPTILWASPQEKITSALNNVKVSARIPDPVEVGVASESSEEMVADLSLLAFGELGFLPVEIYSLAGKICEGDGIIYIYQFSSENEAVTALQRRQQLIVELNKRDYGEVVTKERTQRESDTGLEEIWNYVLENFRFSMKKGKFRGQPAYFYSGHATGDLAQFNPGYNHEIGWVQEKFVITTTASFTPFADIYPLQKVADLVFNEVAKINLHVDKLTVEISGQPEEYEKKTKDLVKEFISAMPLTATARKKALSALDKVSFADCFTGGVPFYCDNPGSIGGTICIPGDEKEYWGHNLVNVNAPAYPIILHAMGHLLHHTIVETNYYFHSCHNSCAGAGHTIWAPPAPTAPPGLVDGETQKAFISFSESAADFFALLAMNFWESRHPEIKQSAFFQRGYLEEFESDARALTAAGKYPGCQVEGVQTRFLRAYYGDQCQASPAKVYADFLATMLQYKENPENQECWFQRVPARTIEQWVFAKSNHSPALGPTSAGDDVYNIAACYRIFAGDDPVPAAAPAEREKGAAITAGERQVSFDKFPVAEINFEEEVKVTKGGINIDLSTAEEQKAIYLSQGTTIKVHNRSLVEVKQGVVGIEGKVVLKTPTCTIEPAWAAVYTEVAGNDTTRIKVLAGRAQVSSGKGKTELKAGEEVIVSNTGSISSATSFDLEAFRKSKFPPEEFPFEPLTGLWIVEFLWRLVVTLVVIIPLALAVLLIYWIMRRNNKKN